MESGVLPAPTLRTLVATTTDAALTVAAWAQAIAAWGQTRHKPAAAAPWCRLPECCCGDSFTPSLQYTTERKAVPTWLFMPRWCRAVPPVADSQGGRGMPFWCFL